MTAHEGKLGSFTYAKENDIHYIENEDCLDYAQKDKFWQEKASNWIKNNPVKYTINYLIRIPRLYIHDYWATNSHWASLSAVDYFQGGVKEIDHEITNTESQTLNRNIRGRLYFELICRVLFSIPYYLTLIATIYALWLRKKEIFNEKFTFLIIFILGTLITCLFPSAQRYHYPFTFIIILFGGWGFESFTKNLLKGCLHENKTPLGLR